MNHYIILDIDGVLNGHEKHANGYCGTRPDCVARLNRIIVATDARLVISSAWRYTVLRGYSNLTGLENLLLTHGLDCHDRIVGVTEPDHYALNRGILIGRWLARNVYGAHRYVVLDNGDDKTGDDLGIGVYHGSGRFVRTNGRVGLTDADADRAIAILKGE